MKTKEEILELLEIEIKHLSGHIGDAQIKMFEIQNNKRNYQNAKRDYEKYKIRLYQTNRIIELIKTGWKPKKRSIVTI